jgi:hypothetical protein
MSIFAQNNCYEAVNISFEEYSSCGNMAVHSVTLSELTPSGVFDSPECIPDSLNDYWVTLTVPDNITNLSFHVFNSDYFPMFVDVSTPILAVYSGNNCADINLIDCFKGNSNSILTNGEIRWESINDLTPGETLYLRIADSANIEQNIFLVVSEISNFQADSCQYPADLENGICNILSVGNNFPAPDNCGWNSTDNVAFYQFEINTNGIYTFDFSGINYIPWQSTDSYPGIQAVIISADDVCNLTYPYDYLYCFSTLEQILYNDIEIEAGSYYLVIDGYSSLSGKSLAYGSISYNFTNIDVQLSETINIYPNPSNGIIMIEAPKGLNYEIIGLTGQKLCEGITNSEIIDLQQFDTGIYIFRIIDKNLNFVEKIIIN